MDSTSTTDLSQQVGELQERLERRNRLLDEIRKSYHRDVLVIKEYLLKLKRKNKITELESSILHDGQRVNLASIPSIDLRKQGLPLYAPEECEMRMIPCFHCGGHLELIHRESSRYIALQEVCDDLKDQVKNLESKVN